MKYLIIIGLITLASCQKTEVAPQPTEKPVLLKVVAVDKDGSMVESPIVNIY